MLVLESTDFEDANAWTDIDFVNDQLTNNESSSDEELRELFFAQTQLSLEVIDMYIGVRGEFLTGERASV